jgi:hypothetical protein
MQPSDATTTTLSTSAQVVRRVIEGGKSSRPQRSNSQT